jgi:hypothetical protein
MKFIALDFETFYFKTTKKDDPRRYTIQDLGNWRYTHDERFDAYMVSAYNGVQALACHPDDFDWACLEGATLLSHNAAFDMAVYERLVELGKVPRVHFADWHCTANMTSYLCCRRALKQAVKHLLGITLSKVERDDMNGKSWEECVKDGSAPALLEYAKNDVIYCWRLWDEFSAQWPEHERKLSQLTIKQGQRGIFIDQPLLEKYKGLVKTAIWTLEGELPWTESGAKPTSTKAIAEECRKVGIPTPPIKAHEGEEAFEEWEKTYGPKYPWIVGVGAWRSLNKVAGTLETISTRLRPDGTIDFSLLVFGGHTGRFSGGGSGLNLQNLLKDSLVFSEGRYVGKKADIKELPEGSELLNMRHLFRARPGKKFIICDAAQIEPRILNWIAGNKELLEKIRQGFSFYESYALTFEGWKGEPGTIKSSLGPERYTRLKNKCVAAGTLVLTDSGYKRIERVALSDKVWDGLQWVSHRGLLDQGEQKVVNVAGEFFTEDHEIYINNREKKPAGALDRREQAAAAEERRVPGSDWADLWKLARAVVAFSAEEAAAVCGVLVSGVWGFAHNTVGFFGPRDFPKVLQLQGEKIGAREEPAEMGAGDR